MKKAPLAGTGMALAAAALWGTIGTAQSFMPAQTSPYWVGALRLVIAIAFFAAAVRVRHGLAACDAFSCTANGPETPRAQAQLIGSIGRGGGIGVADLQTVEQPGEGR